MDLNKHLEFFNPTKLRSQEINIIGCGAIGSNVALQLAKLGVSNLVIWDFDTVDEHNITNQVYDTTDIGRLKIDALKDHLIKQNPQIKVITRKKYTNSPLKGIVILCVDSISMRHHIADVNAYNISIDLLLDGRIGLEIGQVFCIDWTDSQQIENYLKLTDFQDSEVQTPVSACGTTLSVSPSVLITASHIISCLINHVNGKKNPTIITSDAFKFQTAKLK